MRFSYFPTAFALATVMWLPTYLKCQWNRSSLHRFNVGRWAWNVVGIICMKNTLLLMCWHPLLQRRPASCGSLPLFFWDTHHSGVLLPLAVHSFHSHGLWCTFTSIGNDTLLLLLALSRPLKKLILIERWEGMFRMDGFWIALPNADGLVSLLTLQRPAGRAGNAIFN